MNTAMINYPEKPYVEGKLVFSKLGIIITSMEIDGKKTNPWQVLLGFGVGLLVGHYIDVQILPKNPELVKVLNMVDKFIINPNFKLVY